MRGFDGFTKIVCNRFTDVCNRFRLFWKAKKEGLILHRKGGNATFHLFEK